jgi:hypothetical protein
MLSSSIDPGMEEVSELLALGAFDALEIIGDPARSQPVVSGPHRQWREGSRLVVRAEPEPTARAATSGQGSHVVVNIRTGAQPPVVVMAPAGLSVSGEVDAASLRIRDMTGPVRIRMGAGSVTLNRCSGPFHLALGAGSIAIAGTSQGSSTATSGTGSIRLHVGPDADLHLCAECDTGSIHLPGEAAALFADRREMTLGEGRNRLDLRVGVGTIRVTLG